MGADGHDHGSPRCGGIHLPAYWDGADHIVAVQWGDEVPVQVDIHVGYLWRGGPVDHHLVQDLALRDLLLDTRVQVSSQHAVLIDSVGYSHRLPAEILLSVPKNNNCILLCHLGVKVFQVEGSGGTP